MAEPPPANLLPGELRRHSASLTFLGAHEAAAAVLAGADEIDRLRGVLSGRATRPGAIPVGIRVGGRDGKPWALTREEAEHIKGTLNDPGTRETAASLAKLYRVSVATIAKAAVGQHASQREKYAK